MICMMRGVPSKSPTLFSFEFFVFPYLDVSFRFSFLKLFGCSSVCVGKATLQNTFKHLRNN